MPRAHVTIDVDGHLQGAERVRALRGRGGVVNQEMNRGLKGIGGAFMSRFSKHRLEGQGVKVRRRVGSKGRSGQQPSVPVRARAFGFKARISNLDDVDGKAFTASTRSKVAIAHEVGDVVRPQKAGALTIKARGRGRNRIVALAKRVRIAPKLGFIQTFTGFRGEINARLSKMWDRVEQRAGMKR